MKTAIAIICMFSLFILIVSDSSDIYRDPKTLHVTVKYVPDICQALTRKGDLLHVHYTGYLEDGIEFDSSYPRNSPLTFRLGSLQVIEGLQKGLQKTCIGEKRSLIIGSDYAYGATGAPPKIPPYATLYFDVELVQIERNPSLDELNEKFIPGPPDPPKKEL